MFSLFHLCGGERRKHFTRELRHFPGANWPAKVELEVKELGPFQDLSLLCKFQWKMSTTNILAKMWGMLGTSQDRSHGQKWRLKWNPFLFNWVFLVSFCEHGNWDTLWFVNKLGQIFLCPLKGGGSPFWEDNGFVPGPGFCGHFQRETKIIFPCPCSSHCRAGRPLAKPDKNIPGSS